MSKRNVFWPTLLRLAVLSRCNPRQADSAAEPFWSSVTGFRMIEKWLDPYDLKARIVPGLLIVFPILIDALYSAPVLSNWSVFAASSVCGFALVYSLGLLARDLGDRIQEELWESWGGAPSTRFLRYRDGTFGENLKNLIWVGIVAEFSVPPLTAEQEAMNPALADKEIADIFKRVRHYLRDKDANGLWKTHNIEYGFYRNLLGSRVPWLIVAITSTAFAVVFALRTGSTPINPASLLNLVASVCAIYLGWAILPGATKRAAEQYAESAWMAFLRRAEESRQQQCLLRARGEADGM